MRAGAVDTKAGVQGRYSWLSAGLLAASAVAFAVWFVHARGCWDDAGFIHLEFARSLSNGHGFRFDGQVVYGDSAPLWVWLIAGVHAVIPDWLIAGKAVAVAGAVVAMAGVFQFARELARADGRERSFPFAAAMVLLIALNPVFARWAFTGTEVVAAAGLACWGLAAAFGRLTQPISAGRLLLGCACAGAAPLLRPEMVVFSVLLGLVLFVRWVNIPLRFGPKLLVFFVGVLLAMAPAFAWSLYALHVFGSMVPNAYAASVKAPDESALRELLVGYAMGFPVIFFGVLALAGWYVRTRKRGSEARGDQVFAALGASGWVPFVWTAAICVFYLVHRAHVQARYLLVTAPALTVAVLALARMLWPRGYRMGLVAGVVCGIGGSVFVTWPTVSAESKAERVYAGLASFAQTLAAGAPVAARRPGELEFLSGHPVIDMSGLMRPGVLPFRNDVTDNRSVWWMHEQGARYVVLDHAPEPGATRVWSRDLPGTGSILGPERHGSFDVLTVWKLPPSPTLQVPPEMQTEDQP